MPKKSGRRSNRQPSAESGSAASRRSESTSPQRRPESTSNSSRRPASLSRPTVSFPVGVADAIVPPAPPVAEPVVTPRPTPAAPRPSVARSRPGAISRIRPIRATPVASTVDYSYVLSDLRRIGILAAIAFIILGGLTFIIH